MNASGDLLPMAARFARNMADSADAVISGYGMARGCGKLECAGSGGPVCFMRYPSPAVRSGLRSHRSEGADWLPHGQARADNRLWEKFSFDLESFRAIFYGESDQGKGSYSCKRKSGLLALRHFWALRPVAILRLNRASLAPVRALALRLSRAAMWPRVLLLVRRATCFIARPTPTAAADRPRLHLRPGADAGIVNKTSKGCRTILSGGLFSCEISAASLRHRT